MKIENAGLLVLGQVVSTNLYNLGRGVVYAIHGEQKLSSVRSLSGVVSCGGNATFDIAFESGHISRALPECILHGSQWRILDEIKQKEEVAHILQQAMEEERRKQREKEREEQQFRDECQRLKSAPEYAALSQDKKGAVQVTGNIRKELKAKFPGVKFSVRKRSYDSVSVNWTDGPTEEQVKEITGKYRDSYFDGMQDMSISCSSPFNKVYGSVFTDRDYSDAMKQQAIGILKIKYDHLLADEDVSVSRYNSGDLYRIRPDYFGHGYGIHGEINKILAVTTA
ncbi:hypothetical protein PUG46_11810 [Erwiniaceae bacterium L1_55_4]|nr:hypothetical protein [Erwiniaceae bacterium L1_55_4]